ncbi:MAG TPA: hypothetical protein DCQ37_08630 [Desulfobacteraceae bacterium]|nr:hypothetical protein [Desulfobacteraceae bacterium]
MESSIFSAVCARWGMEPESSYGNPVRAVLEDSFKVKVEPYLDFDEHGVVFGKPEEIEMDIIVCNRTLILCEIKSSISKSEMYTFRRKILFYEDRHQRKADRKIAISPMLSQRAIAVAKESDIETYGYPEDVPINR